MPAAQRKFHVNATLPSHLVMDAVAVCEQSAIAAAQLRGQGDEKAADQVAVDAMRRALNDLPMRGLVVIGEGERDEAPMLYIGEAVGQGSGPAVDIALDPLEGTTICAKNMPGSMATLAFATEGGFLYAPDVYMQKLAVGPDVPAGAVDINLPVDENLRRVADALGIAVSELTVCVLDRPRHHALIADIREAGARITLIGDGDVAGVISVADPKSGIDLYMGAGGAPEGVLAAAALRCLGGEIQGKLLFRNDDERQRAAKVGVTDFDRTYHTTDLARGHVLFCAAGVTTGGLLSGVEFDGARATTSSIVMDSHTGTVRRIETVHPNYQLLQK
jgi:fructose-1,6-bisphosphatase II / sedoheptulose-1,7-bisphosphatase